MNRNMYVFYLLGNLEVVATLLDMEATNINVRQHIFTVLSQMLSLHQTISL